MLSVSPMLAPWTMGVLSCGYFGLNGKTCRTCWSSGDWKHLQIRHLYLNDTVRTVDEVWSVGVPVSGGRGSRQRRRSVSVLTRDCYGWGFSATLAGPQRSDF